MTRELAEFAAGLRFEKIPSSVRDQAKLAIVDAIGTVFAGLGERSVELVRSVAAREGRSGHATVLGTKLRLAASSAALANGAAAHALDYDNISLTVSGFVTSPVLFAILAVAEEEGGISGPDFLEAFVTGYEVESGIARGLGVHHYAKGWHSTSTLGHFGAAVAVCKLLKLDPQRFRYAIGIAAAEASGMRTMIGNMTNPFHLGKAARNGIIAGRLVQEGFVAHDSVLEADWGFCNVFNGEGHYDLESMVRSLGAPYDLVDPGLVIKVYPCCGLIHSALDGVLDLVREHELTPGQVRRVRIAVHELVPKTMCFDHPVTGYEAKFSAQFCVATALRERAVRLAYFTDVRTSEPEMQRLMSRVEMVVHPDLHGYDTFLEKEFTDVSITLEDGRELNRRVQRINNKGSKGRPVSLEELKDKFGDCTSQYGNQAALNSAFERLTSIESITDMREVTECLH